MFYVGTRQRTPTPAPPAPSEVPAGGCVYTPRLGKHEVSLHAHPGGEAPRVGAYQNLVFSQAGRVHPPPGGHLRRRRRGGCRCTLPGPKFSSQSVTDSDADPAIQHGFSRRSSPEGSRPQKAPQKSNPKILKNLQAPTPGGPAMYTYTRSAGASGGARRGVGVHAPPGKTHEVSLYTHPGGEAPSAGVYQNLVFSQAGRTPTPRRAPPEAPAERV